MHGSRWRWEETRLVGRTQPRGPGASRRPYQTLLCPGRGAGKAPELPILRSAERRTALRAGAMVAGRSSVRGAGGRLRGVVEAGQGSLIGNISLLCRRSVGRVRNSPFSGCGGSVSVVSAASGRALGSRKRPVVRVGVEKCRHGRCRSVFAFEDGRCGVCN